VQIHHFPNTFPEFGLLLKFEIEPCYRKEIRQGLLFSLEVVLLECLSALCLFEL
jgi:hypothetical protein